MNSNAVLKTESVSSRTSLRQQRFQLSISVLMNLTQLEELNSRKGFLLRDVEKVLQRSKSKTDL